MAAIEYSYGNVISNASGGFSTGLDLPTDTEIMILKNFVIQGPFDSSDPLTLITTNSSGIGITIGSVPSPISGGTYQLVSPSTSGTIYLGSSAFSAGLIVEGKAATSANINAYFSYCAIPDDNALQDNFLSIGAETTATTSFSPLFTLTAHATLTTIITSASVYVSGANSVIFAPQLSVNSGFIIGPCGLVSSSISQYSTYYFTDPVYLPPISSGTTNAFSIYATATGGSSDVEYYVSYIQNAQE